MFAANSFRGKTVAVFGLARSGLACLRALGEGGADAFGWDDSTAAVEAARAGGARIEDLGAVDFNALDALVLSPGVPLTHPRPHWSVERARAAGVEIIGDTEIFAREVAGAGARLVAITGTNGKSTTTALAGHVLREGGVDVHVGGNIGTAVFLLPPPCRGRVYVIEMSSYQIDLSPAIRPDVAVLLNLSPDHLDRHGGMTGYAAVKAKLFANMSGDAAAVVSLDDEWCAAIAEDVAQRVPVSAITVAGQTPGNGVDADDGILRRWVDGAQVGAIDIGAVAALRGRHNWQNAAAVYAVAAALGMSDEAIGKGLRSFAGLAHRMEQVARCGQVVVVNDSKATNAEAASHALKAFERIYWICGGRAKDGGIDELAELFGRVVKAYVIGEAGERFAATLGAAGVDHVIAGDLPRAVALAWADARDDGGDECALLLSPACASFDQYPDFEARGEDFRRLVEKLPGIADNRGEAA